MRQSSKCLPSVLYMQCFCSRLVVLKQFRSLPRLCWLHQSSRFVFRETASQFKIGATLSPSRSSTTKCGSFGHQQTKGLFITYHFVQLAFRLEPLVATYSLNKFAQNEMLMFIFRLQIMTDCFDLDDNGGLLLLASEPKRTRAKVYFVETGAENKDIHVYEQTIANGKVGGNRELSFLTVLAKNSIKASFEVCKVNELY